MLNFSILEWIVQKNQYAFKLSTYGENNIHFIFIWINDYGIYKHNAKYREAGGIRCWPSHCSWYWRDYNWEIRNHIKKACPHLHHISAHMLQNSARYFRNTQSGCVSVYICLSFYTAKKEASLQTERAAEIKRSISKLLVWLFSFFFFF